MIEHVSGQPYEDRRPTRFRILINGRPLRGQRLDDLRSEDVALRLAKSWAAGGDEVRIETMRLNDDGTEPAHGKWRRYHS